jgi:hypothetical protein|tara:strand:- start:267 stop:383 length:117 start_codon:yes stop_codon:yes gene_type:complete
LEKEREREEDKEEEEEERARSLTSDVYIVTLLLVSLFF